MTAANNNSGAGILDSSKMTAKAQPDNNDDDNAGHQMASLGANGAERPVNVDPHLVYFRVGHMDYTALIWQCNI